MTRDELETMIYGKLRNEYETPEIMAAIDEYAEEQNNIGYDQALHDYRVIEIEGGQA